MSKLDDGIIIDPDINPGVGGDVMEALVFDPTQCATFNLIKAFIFPDAVLNTGANGEWLNYGDGSTPTSDQLLVNSWVSANLFSNGSGRLISTDLETHKIATLGDLSLKQYNCTASFWFGSQLTTSFLDVSSPTIKLTFTDGSYYQGTLPYQMVLGSPGTFKVDIGELLMDIIQDRKKPWEGMYSITFSINLNRSPTISGNQMIMVGVYESTTVLPTTNSDDVLRGNSVNPIILDDLYVV